MAGLEASCLGGPRTGAGLWLGSLGWVGCDRPGYRGILAAIEEIFCYCHIDVHLIPWVYQKSLQSNLLLR